MLKDKLTLGKFQTNLGEMIVLVRNNKLVLLEFADRKNIDKQIKQQEKLFQATIEAGKHELIQIIHTQITEYFDNMRKQFELPLSITGTTFQKQVWTALSKLPYGKTLSYSEFANQIKMPKAVRAVANAVAANKLAIVIPCHRIIGAKGTLTGYAGGLKRKEFLLNLENVLI